MSRNPGLYSGGLIHEFSEEEWDRIIDINLKGVWLCMKYEISQMLKQRSGAIVNTSSAVGLMGAADMSAYVASKYGIIGLTKSAALEKSAVRASASTPYAPGLSARHSSRRYWTSPRTRNGFLDWNRSDGKESPVKSLKRFCGSARMPLRLLRDTPCPWMVGWYLESLRPGFDR